MRLLPILILVLFSNFGKTQKQTLPNLIKSNKVTTIAYFDKQTSFGYSVSKKISTFKNGKEKAESNLSQSYDIDIKVTDSSEHSYIYELNYSNFKTEGTKVKEESELQNIMDGIKIKYQTDELGIFDTILNLEELSKKMTESFDILIEKFKTQIKEEEIRTMFVSKMELMKIMLTKPENIEIMFLEDILSIHTFYGFELEVNKPIDLIMEFPILDNLSLEGNATVTLKNIDKTNGQCMFECIEKPNTNEINEFIEYIGWNIFPEYMSKLKNVKDELKTMRYTSNIRVNYTMDLSSGLMKSIKYNTKNNFTHEKKSNKTVAVKEYKLR